MLREHWLAKPEGMEQIKLYCYQYHVDGFYSQERFLIPTLGCVDPQSRPVRNTVLRLDETRPHERWADSSGHCDTAAPICSTVKQTFKCLHRVEHMLLATIF